MSDTLLGGIRVLDFTRVLAGPFCTALLADLGAEVIKIEGPAGDDYRHIPPFSDGDGGLFLLLNRNKHSVVLDMKSEGGREICRDLAKRSDVVVENFRPGVMDRLGLGYDTLIQNNPRLIYASISGFGQDSAMAGLPAYDVVVQALTGLMDVTGDPKGPPTMVGEAVADLSAGLFCSWAVLASLFSRERTGKGRRLDVAMFDSLFSLLPASLVQYLYGDGNPTRVGNRHRLGSPFGTYAAADGYVAIAVLNVAQFEKLAKAIEQPELAADLRFNSNSARLKHDAELREIIEAWSSRLSAADVLEVLQRFDVPAAPVRSVAAAAGSEHVRARELLQAVRRSSGEVCTTMQQPVRFFETPVNSVKAPPTLGQDTRTILRELLGLDARKLEQLQRSGAIPATMQSEEAANQ